MDVSYNKAEPVLSTQANTEIHIAIGSVQAKNTEEIIDVKAR